MTVLFMTVPYRNRTDDLLLRRQSLYPAELRAPDKVNYAKSSSAIQIDLLSQQLQLNDIVPFSLIKPSYTNAQSSPTSGQHYAAAYGRQIAR